MQSHAYKCARTRSNAFKRAQVHSTVFKCTQCSKGIQMLTNAFKCAPMRSKARECTQVRSNALHCIHKYYALKYTQMHWIHSDAIRYTPLRPPPAHKHRHHHQANKPPDNHSPHCACCSFLVSQRNSEGNARKGARGAIHQMHWNAFQRIQMHKQIQMQSKKQCTQMHAIAIQSPLIHTKITQMHSNAFK